MHSLIHTESREDLRLCLAQEVGRGKRLERLQRWSTDQGGGESIPSRYCPDEEAEFVGFYLVMRGSICQVVVEEGYPGEPGQQRLLLDWVGERDQDETIVDLIPQDAVMDFATCGEVRPTKLPLQSGHTSVVTVVTLHESRRLILYFF